MKTEQLAAGATTYTTLGGQVLNLTGLTPEERQHLIRCYAAYRADMAWDQFSHLVVGTENPLLRRTGGVVTPEVWRHPLYQAIRDLEDRLGIRQGEVASDPGDAPERDPLTGAPVPLPTAVAASAS
jgi:hypothetical protein